jgi:hypothetical protein
MVHVGKTGGALVLGLEEGSVGGFAEELYGTVAKAPHGFQEDDAEGVSRTCMVCTVGQVSTCKDKAGAQKDTYAVASKSTSVITRASLQAHALGLKLVKQHDPPVM